MNAEEEQSEERNIYIYLCFYAFSTHRCSKPHGSCEGKSPRYLLKDGSIWNLKNTLSAWSNLTAAERTAIYQSILKVREELKSMRMPSESIRLAMEH
jgi:hypothetical protein